MTVRDLATGKDTADTVKWVRFSGTSWTKDGLGFFYSRYPEPPAGKQLEAKLEHQKLYYHKLGTDRAADIKVYERPDQPSWFVFGGTDETGRYLFVSTSKGTDKNEVYVADLGDPMHPNLHAPVRPVVTGHDANYSPLGVANGRLFMLIDKDLLTMCLYIQGRLLQQAGTARKLSIGLFCAAAVSALISMFPRKLSLPCPLHSCCMSSVFFAAPLFTTGNFLFWFLHSVF